MEHFPEKEVRKLNYDEAAAREAFKNFMPKVEALSNKGLKEIESKELDDIIEECTNIEGTMKGAHIYGQLIDLRIALFNHNGLHTDKAPEDILKQLKKEIANPEELWFSDTVSE